MKIRCRVNYRGIKKSLLSGFANNVLTMLYSHISIFPMPPVTAAALLALKNDFGDKYESYQDRLISKADMLASKAALVAALDLLSAYVDTVASGDAIIIGQGGFVATKGSASEVLPPLKPTGVTLTRSNSNELTAECGVTEGGEYYNAALSAGVPLAADVYINEGGQIVVPQTSGTTPSPGPGPIVNTRFILDLNKSRKKKFIALQSGVTYYVYFWAGNAGGVSPMSDAVSKSAVL